MTISQMKKMEYSSQYSFYFINKNDITSMTWKNQLGVLNRISNLPYISSWEKSFLSIWKPSRPPARFIWNEMKYNTDLAINSAEIYRKILIVIYADIVKLTLFEHEQFLSCAETNFICVGGCVIIKSFGLWITFRSWWCPFRNWPFRSSN